MFITKSEKKSFLSTKTLLQKNANSFKTPEQREKIWSNFDYFGRILNNFFSCNRTINLSKLSYGNNQV